MSTLAVSTKNKKGFTYPLTSFGKAFVNFAARSSHPVMDIGAAYGIATLPALLHGAHVIAVDVEAAHLAALRDSIDPSVALRLNTFQKRFPDFDMRSESLGAVYMSQVLPFLKGTEIELGARKIYDWLVPGGEVFIVSFTPYIRHVSSFIPLYETRKLRGERWAGYISDVSAFSDQPEIREQLPNEIHHIDADDLKWAFELAGFEIKEIRYFGEEEGALPPGISFDGKERVGMIARKPDTGSKDVAKTSWRNISSTDSGYIPPSVNEWVSKPFVLSQALRKVCDNFSVKISDQSVKPLYSDEIDALKCYESETGYVRETYLGDTSNPLVYARVSMPESTYEAFRIQLDNLGSRPIGETLLYSDPTYTRTEFEVKRLCQDDELLFDALVHHQFYRAMIAKDTQSRELWARRSVFTLSGNPLLVTEVFMPDMPRYID
jgi:chorismate-pyruvate lyase/SAM-dependent methyltransferase